MLWGNYIFGLSKYQFTFMPSGNLHYKMSQLGFSFKIDLKLVPSLVHSRFFYMYKCNNFGMNFTSNFLYELNPFYFDVVLRTIPCHLKTNTNIRNIIGLHLFSALVDCLKTQNFRLLELLSQKEDNFLELQVYRLCQYFGKQQIIKSSSNLGKWSKLIVL